MRDDGRERREEAGKHEKQISDLKFQKMDNPHCPPSPRLPSSLRLPPSLKLRRTGRRDQMAGQAQICTVYKKFLVYLMSANGFLRNKLNFALIAAFYPVLLPS
jgi:hypothetical protein